MDFSTENWAEHLLQWLHKQEERSALIIAKLLLAFAAKIARERFSETRLRFLQEDIAMQTLAQIKTTFSKKTSAEIIAMNSTGGLVSYFYTAVLNRFKKLVDTKEYKIIQRMAVDKESTEKGEEVSFKMWTDLEKQEEFVSNAKGPLKECLKHLRNKQEHAWLAFRCWIEVQNNINWEDNLLKSIRDIPDRDIGSVTKRTAILIRELVKEPHPDLDLLAETIKKIDTTLNPETLKSYVKRSRYFLRNCLEKKGIRYFL